MSKDLEFFKRILYEAEDGPDLSVDSGDAPDTADAPDLSMDDSQDAVGDAPELDMDETYDANEQDESQEQQQELELDEKISTVMNMNLYKRYLSLLNGIGAQISTIKSKNDMLQSLSPESTSITSSLNQLDENIRLYITNHFMDEKYSKNLLFFNKCLNLYKLLNDVFVKNVKSGIS